MSRLLCERYLVDLIINENEYSMIAAVGLVAKMFIEEEKDEEMWDREKWRCSRLIRWRITVKKWILWAIFSLLWFMPKWTTKNEKNDKESSWQHYITDKWQRQVLKRDHLEMMCSSFSIKSMRKTKRFGSSFANLPFGHVIQDNENVQFDFDQDHRCLTHN